MCSVFHHLCVPSNFSSIPPALATRPRTWAKPNNIQLASLLRSYSPLLSPIPSHSLSLCDHGGGSRSGNCGWRSTEEVWFSLPLSRSLWPWRQREIRSHRRPDLARPRLRLEGVGDSLIEVTIEVTVTHPPLTHSPLLPCVPSLVSPGQTTQRPPRHGMAWGCAGKRLPALAGRCLISPTRRGWNAAPLPSPSI
jgi:hypothetical protein